MFRRTRRLLLFVVALAIGFLLWQGPSNGQSALDVNGAKPAGARYLGLAIGEGKGQSWDETFAKAVAAGVNYVELPIAWDDVETTPGVYAPDPDWAAIGGGFYGAQNMRIALSFLSVDTTADRRPEWLQGKDWDDPAVIDAGFAVLVRTLDALSGAKLHSISLGNEIDIRLGGKSVEQMAFTNFANALRQRLRDHGVTASIGVKVTAQGLLGGEREFVQTITAGMDVAQVTYYPLDSGFRLRGPDTVGRDLSDILALLGDKPVHLAEIGYPSGDNCGSSLADQAAFVANAFTAWDAHSDRIEAMLWDWQTDISAVALAGYRDYYGLNNRCFLEYLGTLGLNSRDGTAKPGWHAFVAQARARGFKR